MEQAGRRGIALDEVAKLRLQGWQRILESNLDIAKRISREGLDPRVQDRMLTAANRVLGDYTTMSAIERDVIRRFLIPFYPFYRHILKFTLKMPYNHPLKSNVFRLVDILDREMAPLLPEWLHDSVKLGQLGGLDAYWNLGNMNPMDFFSSKRSTQVFNPFVKTFAQGMFGVNDFGVPYSDLATDVYETGNGLKFQWTPEGWQLMEGVYHPPWWKMFASQFGFPMTYFNLRGSKNYSPVTTALQQMGISLSRYDTGKYQRNYWEAQKQANTYGVPPGG